MPVTEVRHLKWFWVQKEMMKLGFCLQTGASRETLLVYSVTRMPQPKKKSNMKKAILVSDAQSASLLSPDMS